MCLVVALLCGQLQEAARTGAPRMGLAAETGWGRDAKQPEQEAAG